MAWALTGRCLERVMGARSSGAVSSLHLSVWPRQAARRPGVAIVAVLSFFFPVDKPTYLQAEGVLCTTALQRL